MYTVVLDVDCGERPPTGSSRAMRVVCVRACGGCGCVGMGVTRFCTRWRVRQCVRCVVCRSGARCVATTQGTPWEFPVREACVACAPLGCSSVYVLVSGVCVVMGVDLWDEGCMDVHSRVVWCSTFCLNLHPPWRTW